MHVYSVPLNTVKPVIRAYQRPLQPCFANKSSEDFQLIYNYYDIYYPHSPQRPVAGDCPSVTLSLDMIKTLKFV